VSWPTARDSSTDTHTDNRAYGGPGDNANTDTHTYAHADTEAIGGSGAFSLNI
jgi:hypothetical protein